MAEQAPSPSPQPGGFLPQTGLPSPAPSSASAASRAASALPHPRNRSLQPGSSKEDMVRRYVEERLLHVSRRYVKKFGNPEPGDSVVGYKTFGEVSRDLDGIVNVLWLSGTRESSVHGKYVDPEPRLMHRPPAGLQVPFLLKLASDFTQYVRSFPPSPKASFDLLTKLDHCFSSLLSGQDVDSGETLPGFENGLRAGMTVTDMVRCRSLVEQTRVLMVEVLSGDVEEEEEEEEDVDESDTDGGEQFGWDIDEDKMHLDAARIYEHTIVQLGNRLGDPLRDTRVVTDD